MNIDRITAIRYIHTPGKGVKEELISKIGEELYKEFCLLGYISQGVNGSGVKTWIATNLGKKQFDFFREPTTEERKLGLYFASLGV
jgi:hypothetical protein